jgi:hypothetical protein
MKTNLISRNSVIPLVLMLSTLLNFAAFAQRSPIQNFRHYDKRGINVFESPKEDTVVFDDLALRLGANFTQVAFLFTTWALVSRWHKPT